MSKQETRAYNIHWLVQSWEHVHTFSTQKSACYFLPNYEPAHNLFPGKRWIKNIYSYILYIYIVYFFHHKQNKNHVFSSHLLIFSYTIRVVQRPFIYSLLRDKNNVTIQTIWITIDRGVQFAVEDGDSNLYWICLLSFKEMFYILVITVKFAKSHFNLLKNTWSKQAL